MLYRGLTMKIIFIACTSIMSILLKDPILTEAVVFKFTNVVCASYNESWFTFHKCRLKAISRDKIILNINGSVLHKVNTIHAHAKIFKRETGYKPWLIDTKIDACRFMRRQYDPFAKIVYNLFNDFSNINHTCPFVGPQLIEGLYLRPNLLILPFPTGDYMLVIRWFFERKLVFDTNVSFMFVEDPRDRKESIF